ncbi:hypothetical protein SEA_RIZWANA_77 [Arthrobacter phage Rizwana]|nr:hypothetical protein SEA_RIZWANA_77 [Arthrobacter phage Rizwana]
MATLADTIGTSIEDASTSLDEYDRTYYAADHRGLTNMLRQLVATG